MRVLLVGAAGFLGRYIEASLIEAGHTVVSVDVMPEPQPRPQQPTQWHQVDMKTAHWDSLGEGVDAVVCSAAVLALSSSSSDWTAVLQTNVIATARLIQWAASHSPRTFVFTSSAGMYERNLDGSPIRENAPMQLAAPYWTAKLMIEQLLLSPEVAGQMTPTILRMSSPYGPGQRTGSVLPQFVAAARSNLPITVFDGGLRTQDFIWIEDAAHAHVRSLDLAPNTQGGILNLGSGQETSMMTLAELVVEAFDSNSPIVSRPSESPDVTRFPLSIERAEQVLSLRPKTLQEGLRELRERSS